MAASPKALLLLGVLFAALLLLSSHVTDAAEEKQTKETATEAAEVTVVDNKHGCRCCSWWRHGNLGLRCHRCCAAGEEAPPQVTHVVDDNKQVCPHGRCCSWWRHGNLGLRCHRCCAAGEEAPAQIVDEEVETEEPQN